ncbi:hypothetical protein HMPREF0528_1712 [Lactobacillus johnsonii ATCC 33200]|uniref:Uncharacterized protein n=1 Tax=Lactobacillus johnsonii ATCC 33200 TaxID=525330 RepID=C2E7I8_LACJH|nr:hypothetical protein HMPREF0528_1712 [Lactobacillus johnsonii ATCC 33200]
MTPLPAPLTAPQAAPPPISLAHVPTFFRFPPPRISFNCISVILFIFFLLLYFFTYNNIPNHLYDLGYNEYSSFFVLILQFCTKLILLIPPHYLHLLLSLLRSLQMVADQVKYYLVH